jgi:hypothetical protein
MEGGTAKHEDVRDDGPPSSSAAREFETSDDHGYEEDGYHSFFKTALTHSKYSKDTVMGERPTLRKAKKIILDCDPGGDDAQALVLAFYLAQKLDVEIIGVTTVAGNAVLEQVVWNA